MMNFLSTAWSWISSPFITIKEAARDVANAVFDAGRFLARGSSDASIFVVDMVAAFINGTIVNGYVGIACGIGGLIGGAPGAFIVGLVIYLSTMTGVLQACFDSRTRYETVGGEDTKMSDYAYASLEQLRNLAERVAKKVESDRNAPIHVPA